MASPRLTRQQQMDHDLLVEITLLRIRRRQRGQRWARCFITRKGW